LKCLRRRFFVTRPMPEPQSVRVSEVRLNKGIIASTQGFYNSSQELKSINSKHPRINNLNIT
jgi:hypothetical protein